MKQVNWENEIWTKTQRSHPGDLGKGFPGGWGASADSPGPADSQAWPGGRKAAAREERGEEMRTHGGERSGGRHVRAGSHCGPRSSRGRAPSRKGCDLTHIWKALVWRWSWNWGPERQGWIRRCWWPAPGWGRRTFGIDMWTLSSVSSVPQLCPTLCDPVNRSTPGLPVHHQLPEFTQTHAHWISDAIQPSHPLPSPSPPAPNPSQHQGLFQSVNSSHEVAKVLQFQLQHQSFQWTPRTDLL